MPDSQREPFASVLVEFAKLRPGMRVLDLSERMRERDLPDHSIDAVLGGFVLHVLPPATLAEVARVLRPGGVFAIALPGPSDAGGWWASYQRIVAEFAAKAGMDGETVTWRREAERAGLHVVSETNVEVSLPIEGPSAHWQWLLSHGDRRLYDALTEPDREEFAQRVLCSLVQDHPAHGTRLIAGATLYRMTT